MKFLYPIIAVALAIYVFFGQTRAVLDKRIPLNEKKSSLEIAVASAGLIKDKYSQLSDKYNNIPSSDIDKLDKLLPTHVDNVRLIIDVNEIAKKYGMRMRGISVSQKSDDKDKLQLKSKTDIDYIDLGFSISGDYESLKLFLDDLAKSLRLVDVISIRFAGGDKDFFDYTVEIRTYWLPYVATNNGKTTQ